MMRQMTRDLRAEIARAGREWQFLDAPLAASGPAQPFVAKRWPGGPYREWWNAKERDGTVEYQGAQRSIQVLGQSLQQSPADLLVGYSQGAVAAATVTAMFERGHLGVGKRAWRGVILFNSGPPPRDPALAHWFEQPLATPSLHVLGGPADIWYDAQRAMCEVWSSQTRTVIEHDEGHQPPSTRNPETLRAIENWIDQVNRSRGRGDP